MPTTNHLPNPSIPKVYESLFNRFIVAVIFLTSVPFFANAQKQNENDTIKPFKNEIGIFYNKIGYILYRRPWSYNKTLRVDLQNFSSNFQGNQTSNRSNIDLIFGVGLEKEKLVKERFTIYHGARLNFWYYVNYESATGSGNSIYGVGIGYILGVKTWISRNFYIGLEAIPNFSLIVQPIKSIGDNFSTINNLNSSFVGLTMGYRFY